MRLLKPLDAQRQRRDDHHGLMRSGNDVLATPQASASVDKGEGEQSFSAEDNAARLENAHPKGQLEVGRSANQELRQPAQDHRNHVAMQVIALMIVVAMLVTQLAWSSITVAKHNPNPTTFNITLMIGGHNAQSQSPAVSTTTIQAGNGSLINTGSLNTAGGMVNLGDLSDQARLTIEAIPDQGPGDGQPSLRQLLQELKDSVDADSQVPATSRAEALAQIKELASAAQDPNKSVGPAHRAIKAIQSLSETNKAVAETSKLVGAVKTVLPLIAGFFLG